MHIHTHLATLHCRAALWTHIHTHLAIHALPHSTVHAHTHTSGYSGTSTQHCARKYMHIWLSMHYKTTPCTHKHTQALTHGNTQMNNWLHMHCHTALFIPYTHTWPSMHYKTTPGTCTHKWLHMHCHKDLFPYIDTDTWPSMHYKTIPSTHTTQSDTHPYTHQAIHSLQDNPMQTFTHTQTLTHAHTRGYACTATLSREPIFLPFHLDRYAATCHTIPIYHACRYTPYNAMLHHSIPHHSTIVQCMLV